MRLQRRVRALEMVVMLAVAGLVVNQARGQVVYYVNAAAPAGGNGLRWGSAFQNIQDGLNAADLATSGAVIAEVWVAAGTYRVPEGNGGQNPTHFILNGSDVHLYGGFTGFESSRAERNPEANPTVLSGDADGDDGTTGDRTDNTSTGIIRIQDATREVVIDGLVLSLAGSGLGDDGALVVSNFGSSSLIVRNCRFIQNFGPGISATRSSLLVERCEFASNQVNSSGGGGIRWNSSGQQAQDRSMTIRDSRFIGNQAFDNNGSSLGGNGGAVQALGDPVRIERCVFDVNRAGEGGALWSDNSVTLVACDFLRNAASGAAGAVFGTGDIVTCRFRGNIAASAGALLTNGPSTLTNVEFVGNRSTGRGGALVASSGSVTPPAITLNHCTVTDNASTTTTADGVDIAGTFTCLLRNSILWNNGGSIEVNQIQIAAGLGALSSNYSTVQGASGALRGRGIGNLGELSAHDPMFVRPPNPGANGYGDTDDDYGNLDLLPPSTAIDSGDSTTLPLDVADVDFDGVSAEPLPTDLAGRFRVVDHPVVTNAGLGFPPVDRGAYEAGSSVPQQRLYVRADASISGDGNSWETALPSLANALERAALVGSGVNQIWVARGTYTPSERIPPNASPATISTFRDRSFVLPANVAIYGGFAGNETSLDQRTPESVAANPTVLSGDLNADDAGDNNLGDNARKIVTLASGCTLDGLILRDGVSEIPTGSGSGVSGFQVENVLIRDCRIENNRASFAAGLVITSSRENILVERTVFRGNLAAVSGAGGAAINSATIRFIDCAFESNRSDVNPTDGIGGGAAKVFNGSVTEFIGCTFARNFSPNGSAVGAATDSQVRLIGCRVLGNTSPTGGALHSTGKLRWTITNSEFSGNSSGSGAAAISVIYSGAPTSIAFLNVLNSTFSGNRSTGTGSGAVTVANLNGHESTFHNCLFWANTSGTLSGREAQLFSTGAEPQMSNCSIQGYLPPFGTGTANNAADPAFVRAASAGADGVFGTPDDDYGDLRLTPSSAAIDSGNTALVPADSFDIDDDGNTTEVLPLDLSGGPRLFDHPTVINSGSGSPPVDRGAYEFVPPVCPPLIDDGIRNWANRSGGAFLSPGNWLPCVPLVTSEAIFDAAGAYTVAFPAPQPGEGTYEVAGLTVRRDAVALNLDGRTLTLGRVAPEGTLVVGQQAGDDAALTLNVGSGGPGGANGVGGRVATSLGASCYIGLDTFASGTLNVIGNGNTLFDEDLFIGEPNLLIGGPLSVGRQGFGSLTISNGALVFSSIGGIAEITGSVGRVDVNGAGSLWVVPFLLSVGHPAPSAPTPAGAAGVLRATDGGRVVTDEGQVFIYQNGLLSGDGEIKADTDSIGRVRPGIDSPGPLPADPAVHAPGRLTITGNYRQRGRIPLLGTDTGVLDISLGGSGAISGGGAEYDVLRINASTFSAGAATLDGGLIVSALADLTVPTNPADFRARVLESAAPLAASSRFDVALLPAVPGRENDLFFSLVYGPSAGPSVGELWPGAVEIRLGGFSNGLGVDPVLPPTDPTLLGEATATELADLNGDELDDLVVVYRREVTVNNVTTLNNSVHIFLNLGPGAPGGAIFGPSIVKNLPNLPVTLRTTSVAIAQIDELGGPDLTFAHDPGDGSSGFVTHISNSGAGTPAAFVTVPGSGPGGELRLTVGRGPSSIVVANLKDRSVPGGSTRPELAVATRLDPTPAVTIYELPTPGAAAAYAFAQIGVAIATGQGPAHMAVSDSDNGKRSDLLIANESSNSVTIIPGGPTGDRYTHDAAFTLGVGSRPVRVKGVRFGGPAAPAGVVTVNKGTSPEPGDIDPVDPGSISVILRTAAVTAPASFQPSVELPAGLNPFAFVAADLDGDTDADLGVVTNVGSVLAEDLRLRVLRNDQVVNGVPGTQLTYVPSSDEAVNPLVRFALSGRITPSPVEGVVIVSGSGEGSGPDPGDPATYFRGEIYPLTPRAARPPTCPADFNADGNLDPDDLGDYINCYFSTPPCDRADITGDGGVDPDDLGDFINAYFGGC